ncbi:ferredoxin [Halodesulfurarchaeum sp.]|uniref:ferredoxin n=1 Tax=Halodesulfurarchaeum sp. TaxID=1980530 RepID=UPI001BBA5632|nr:ferredoxin [Halodesulfurarchaeum sp.]
MATVEIDQDLCIGDQVCASMHPDIYEMGDDGFAYVVDGMEEVEGDVVDRAREGAEACPVDAITVSE